MVDNSDFKCAYYAKEIAEVVKEEALIGKVLGVLQENGVYAFYLYALSLKEKAKAIVNQSSKLLKAHDLIGNNEVTSFNVKDIIAPLTNNIDNLFFAKELLERMLVYARYHAKALGGSE